MIKMANFDLVRKWMVFMAVIFAMAYFVMQAPLASGWGPLNNYMNFSVRTTVNITEAIPEILNIYCNGTSITLSAGTTQKVVCVVMIRDYNGADTLNSSSNSTVNATFYYFQNKSSDLDDANVHYTNASCLQNGSEFGTGNYYINYTCAFDIWYYANNGTWFVNSTVKDGHNDFNFTTFSSNTTMINALYALNVTEEINFGDMYVGETTAPGSGVQANITNFGNMAINFTVYGYGGENATRWATAAMNCSIARNISLNSERYSINSGADWADMTPISGAATLVPNITLLKQTLPGSLVLNSTYWGLHINVSDNPAGICQGTVIFSAISAS